MSATPPVLPLFYTDLQPLTLDAHRGWRLKDGNAAFARDALGIPVVVGEFADAALCCPLLFAAGDEGGPIVLTGVDGGNLFVKDGAWDSSTYVPAYIRRYPFILAAVSAEDPTRFALGIDPASDRFVRTGEEGAALFDGDKPSELTNSVMEFCKAYTEQIAATRAFRDALRAKELLVDRRLDFTLPEDKKFTVEGFQIIDAQKLTDLDAETVVEWHRRGWLSACYFHLASLSRVNELVLRRSRVATSG